MLAPLSERDVPGPFVDIGLAALRDSSRWIESVGRLARMQVDFVRSGVLMVAGTPNGQVLCGSAKNGSGTLDPSVEYLHTAALLKRAPYLGHGFTSALHLTGVALEMRVPSPAAAWRRSRRATP
jgi:hypothetical protein